MASRDHRVVAAREGRVLTIILPEGTARAAQLGQATEGMVWRFYGNYIPDGAQRDRWANSGSWSHLLQGEFG